jgi:hypothetical protein
MNPVRDLRIDNVLAKIDAVYGEREPAPRCAFLSVRTTALVGVSFKADLELEPAIHHY